MDERLVRAIGTPSIQQQAGELIRLALKALDDLRMLDESLYERFVASRSAPTDPASTASGLRKLWAETFGGVVELLDFCKGILIDDATTTTQSAGDGAISFDFGDLEGDGADSITEVEPSLDFGNDDLGGLLDGIDETEQEGDAEKWAKVLEKLRSIEYGLRSQQSEAQSRMEIALGAGEINQVLSLLDDTQSSTSEGVHAVVSVVYEAFLPDVNPATVVPGYLTALGRALLVRRGIAELSSALEPYNSVLQSGHVDVHEAALDKVRTIMREFVGSVVCKAMRAADRWEVVEFDRYLSEQPLKLARLTSEGLVKYLESLSSVNQREVLLLHDQRTLEEMQEALTSARSLLDLSPKTAIDMLDRAYQAAQRLRGRKVQTDQMIVALERYAPTSSNVGKENAVKFLEQLELLLHASS